MIPFRHLAGALLAAFACFASVKASASTPHIYESWVVPGYAVSDREMIFQVANNLDQSLDTFHFDFASRRWTLLNETGAVSGTWTPEQDEYFDPAILKRGKPRFCGGHPSKVLFCLIVVPAACEISSSAAFRRAQRACEQHGGLLEVRNSGTCGNGMQTRCIPRHDRPVKMP